MCVLVVVVVGGGVLGGPVACCKSNMCSTVLPARISASCCAAPGSLEDMVVSPCGPCTLQARVPGGEAGGAGGGCGEH